MADRHYEQEYFSGTEKENNSYGSAVCSEAAFWQAGLVVLAFCLSLFCYDAGAVLYNIFNGGDSDVYGLWESGDLSVPEPNYAFGVVIATNIFWR